MTERHPRRVLIVGTKFGEIYANAFLDDMLGVPLAVIMANGSERSRKLAHAFGVPLYTRLEDVPRDIDMACVVVRSTIVGGEGVPAWRKACCAGAFMSCRNIPSTRRKSPARRNWHANCAGFIGSAAFTAARQPGKSGSTRPVRFKSASPRRSPPLPRAGNYSIPASTCCFR